MLKLKRLPIDTDSEHFAYLHRNCADYPEAEFQALNRITVGTERHRIPATLHVTDDASLVAPDQLGLSAFAFEALGLAEGATITLAHRPAPASQDILRRRMAGGALSDADADWLIADMVAGLYPDEEMAAFLVAATQAMSDDEVLSIARARAKHARRMQWDAPVVVDKHSMGGIPGNRVTMIVVPIVAAHGLTIPKTSSRAITSPAGTADCMETLARVDLTPDEVRAVVEHANGCIAWNGRLNHSFVDDVMNRITRPLGLDSRKWSAASILSKKRAAGSTHVVIDIPTGPGAKLKDRAEAKALGDLFVAVGNGLGLTVEYHATDGEKPIGKGIGPALEARDVMDVLRGVPHAPQDLADKAVYFAGRILEFDNAVAAGHGATRARELLGSGDAMTSMERIIDRQGPVSRPVLPGPLVHEAAAPRDGTVSAIDCYRISGIARRAGAPMDKGAGIDLLKAAGDPVRKGEPLYRIHAHIEGDFKDAVEMAEEECGYGLS